MARPAKRGLEYFNVPVSYFQDDKFWFVLNEIGLEAEIIFMRLLAKIYGNQGFYYFLGDKELKILSGQTRIPEEKIKDILNAFFENGLFDKEKFERYKILTSYEIQEQYFTIIKNSKRKILISEKEYPYVYPEVNELFDLDLPEIEEDINEVSQSVKTVSSENFGIIPENSGKTPKNSENFGVIPENSRKTPTKVNKSKVKKSKEKKSKKHSTVTGAVENFSESSDLLYWEKLLGDFAAVWGAVPGAALKKKLIQWVEYKRDKGFLYYPGSDPWIEFIERLSQLSGGDQSVALAILKQSLEHNWVDVYPFIPLSPEGITQKWTAFLKALKKDAPQLYEYATQLQFRTFKDGVVTIRGPDTAISILEDVPDPNPYFQNLRRFFGKNIKVEYEVLQRVKKAKNEPDFSKKVS